MFQVIGMHSCEQNNTFLIYHDDIKKCVQNVSKTLGKHVIARPVLTYQKPYQTDIGKVSVDLHLLCFG